MHRNRALTVNPEVVMLQFSLTRPMRLVLIVLLIAIHIPTRVHAKSAIDSFYATPDSPPAKPGLLLKDEPFPGDVPAGVLLHRILFTTTRFDGEIAVASALVVAPQPAVATPVAAQSPGVILWAHGTTGIARQCAPSLMNAPLDEGIIPALQPILAHGWTVVAPDYIGLGTEGPHPYLIGAPTAWSSIDAVRAARQMDAFSFGDATVVWGHSQGGAAALWIGIEQPTYAPDVPLAGIAAIAPASDLIGIATTAIHAPSTGIFMLFALRAYSQVYPDVPWDDAINPADRDAVNKVVDHCLWQPQLVEGLPEMNGLTALRFDVMAGPVLLRLTENTPLAKITIPVLIAQGTMDEVVPFEVQERFVANWCEAGTVVDYREYAGREHGSIVADDSPLIPDLMAWTVARFGNDAVPATCSTTVE
ncbi:MAG TPA: alpha/beta fold hydrolase [Thermomicrobiales bacterium]|nr:alpha/beta fold hydrolase [Thermomicrobiales bacterium]